MDEASHKRKRKKKTKTKKPPLLYRNSKNKLNFFSSLLSSSSLPSQPRRISVFFGCFLLVYLTLFCILRLDREGADGMNDLLWLCNLSLVLGASGMIFHNTLFIGISMACVAFSHISFTYDLIFWTLFDQFPLGRTTFIEESSLSSLWWTTLHQTWYLPICFTVLYIDYEHEGIKSICWVYSTFINLGLALIARVSRYTIQDKKLIYQHLNTGHEFWTETQTLIHRYDSSPWFIYLLWQLLFESFFLNGICFLFLKLFSKLLLEKSDIAFGSHKSHKQL
eukprot:TRINITY_DN588_c0_g1_i1.p1 TRINITY_DN588_c0_g1~~TRINITY_DN588_c0_g1_i1.p1  ORF type:complete len:279 (-),score=24.43 TRINITY_DN588_c0_g1_i1:19-855(-)